MSRGFIFTMDAVLALIPLFLALGTISHVGGGGSLYLQGSLLGTERMAQDTLRILEIKGDITSTNATDLNTTLQWIIPSYLNYSYLTIDSDTGLAAVNLSRGAPSNTTDIVPSGTVVAVSSEINNITAFPNLLARSFVATQDESDAFNTLLFALVGITSPGGKGVVITDFPTATQWNNVEFVSVSLRNLSTNWGSSNNTLDFMLDRLLAKANAQGYSDAVDGLTELKLILDNASRGTMTYDVSAILDPYPLPSAYDNMTIGGADVIYAAFQSANYNNGTTTSANITSSDGKYRIKAYARMGQVGKVYVAHEGSILPSEKGNVTVEVWLKKATNYNYTLNDTLKLQVLRPACFNVTELSLDTQTAGIVHIRTYSGACSPDGLINATVKNETTSSFASMNLNEYSRLLAPNFYPGIPIMESERIFNATASGNTFYLNWNNSYNAAGNELNGILGQLPLTRVDLVGSNSVGEMNGQVNVGSTLYSVKRYIITLTLWGD